MEKMLEAENNLEFTDPSEFYLYSQSVSPSLSQSCPTPCDLMDCRPRGTSVHEISR